MAAASEQQAWVPSWSCHCANSSVCHRACFWTLRLSALTKGSCEVGRGGGLAACTCPGIPSDPAVSLAWRGTGWAGEACGVRPQLGCGGKEGARGSQSQGGDITDWVLDSQGATLLS